MNVNRCGDDGVAKKIKAYFAGFGSYPATVIDDGVKFCARKDIRKFLATALDANIIRVYANESTQPERALMVADSKPWALDLSSETFYIITKSGNILRMTNSEWGELRIADNMKED